MSVNQLKYQFFFSNTGLSSPTQQPPWEQKPHWIDHKPPQMPLHSHLPPPHSSHPPPQMGGYVPQYWYQPETNPALLST
jgi:homeobox protein DLX2